MYNINQIRTTLEKNIGKKILLRAVKGRKRYTIPYCIIEKTYPGIFVVSTTDPITLKPKSMSFSYADILTGTIEIRLHKDIEAS